MSELKEQNFSVLLNEIQRQFLCCYPINCILWQDLPKDLGWEQQKTLMDHTFNSSLNKEFPIKLSYQINFLKKLILFLESNCAEVHDAIYETFCRIQQDPENDGSKKFAFKHYIIDTGTHLTMRESKCFVAEGTTGLCSWQASLALADFLIENPDVVKDKCVLELGAGTGLCGLTMLKMCHPRHLLLTDGSNLCVELMCESLTRNFPGTIEHETKFKVDTKIIECLEVAWEYIEDKAEIALLKPDVIIAADVVYDESIFKALSSAINYVFNLKKDKVQMYLAATIRNDVTLNRFFEIMESLCYKITQCDTIPVRKSHLFWDRSTAVKILKLSR